MLNGKLELHDVRDVEAFCVRILQRTTLTPQDHEDALAYLIESCWLLSTQYQPGTASFSTYAGKQLPRRLIDWQRKRKDTRYPSNTRYTQHSLDTINTTKRNGNIDDYGDHRTDYLRSRLEHTHTHTSHDHPRDRTADQLVRLLRTRSRSTTRNHHPPHPRTTNQPTQQP
jgi:DNA-directed RNA polymerase specialized sigma24 family protein